MSTRERLEKLRDRWREMHECYSPKFTIYGEHADAIDAILAELPAAPAAITLDDFAYEACAKVLYGVTVDEDGLPNDPFDMGIYPAAIKGYNDERDYEQRDGYKNGWNAACREFIEIRKKLAEQVRALTPAAAVEARDAALLEARMDEHSVCVHCTPDRQCHRYLTLRADLAAKRATATRSER